MKVHIRIIRIMNINENIIVGGMHTSGCRCDYLASNGRLIGDDIYPLMTTYDNYPKRDYQMTLTSSRDI